MTVVLTGIIGRPRCIRIQRGFFFTAGLGIRRIDGQLEWFPIEARGEVATALITKARGEEVTVTGSWITKHWVKDGVPHSREVFVVGRFDEAT